MRSRERHRQGGGGGSGSQGHGLYTHIADLICFVMVAADDCGLQGCYWWGRLMLLLFPNAGQGVPVACGA